MQPKLRSALLLLAIAGAPGATLACSCVPLGAPQEEMAKSYNTAVFRGRVIGIEPRGGLLPLVQVSFEVSTVWKGPRDPLHLSTTLVDSATCGRAFTLGQEYVVYQGIGGDISLCSRTARVSEAAADLAALGPGQPPQAASLSRVGRHAHLSGSWYNPQRSGEGFVIETLDDTRGVVTWFGYDAADPQRQAWMSGVGVFDGIELHVAELLRPVGGGFGDGFRADRVERPVWGSLTLRLHTDGTGEALFRPTGAGSTTARFAIQRLTRPPAPPLPAAVP